MNDSVGTTLLIIGNGFDLDLGLNTRYSDFWNSKRWQEAQSSCPEKYLVDSLEKFRVSHQWFDLESGLQEGAKRLLNKLGPDFDASNYRQSFDILKNELKAYIEDVQAHFSLKEQSVAINILSAVELNSAFNSIYTFNYTSLIELAHRCDIYDLPPVQHIHGSLEASDDIILGIELEDPSIIPPQLTFLIKSNSPYYHFNHLLSDLEAADEVIFFGHSINGMDFPYFKEYFRRLAESSAPINDKKRITIITYDAGSAMLIKDNFRMNGIDVRTLYNRVLLDFIYTRDIYEGKQMDVDKLSAMLSHLRVKDMITR